MTYILLRSKIEQAQKDRVNRATALPHNLFTGAITQAKESYKQLSHRYGARYYKAILSAAVFTFFLPIPGSFLVGVALIVVIAEVHRAISRRSPETLADVVLAVRANMPSWMRGRRRAPPCS